MNTSAQYSQPFTMDIEHLFSLSVNQKETSTSITMQVHGHEVSTSRIPFIVDVLQQHLPNVLKTQCYNDDGLPFAAEVKNTEVGHLFEHILLEYLCQLKIAKGHRSAAFAGRTRWNWIKDPRGKFHINLNCGNKDTDILYPAITMTIHLMKKVLRSGQPMLFSQRSASFAQNGLKNGRKAKRRTLRNSA